MNYRISPDLQPWALKVMQTTLDGVGNQAPFVTDRKLLNSMTNRPGLACCA